MKTIITSLLIAIASMTLQAQTIDISVENIRQKGDMMVGVFASQEDFDNQKITAGRVVSVQNNESPKSFSFTLESGNYGVAIYVDSNGNGQFDWGTEMYGFSNGYIPRSYPIYSEFAFTLNINYQETITLRK